MCEYTISLLINIHICMMGDWHYQIVRPMMNMEKFEDNAMDMGENADIYADMPALEDIYSCDVFIEDGGIEMAQEGGEDIAHIDAWADMPALEDLYTHNVIIIDDDNAVFEQVDVPYDDDEEDPALYYNNHAGHCKISCCSNCARYYCESCRPEHSERSQCGWYPMRDHYFCSWECGWHHGLDCSIECFYVDRQRKQRKG